MNTKAVVVTLIFHALKARFTAELVNAIMIMMFMKICLDSKVLYLGENSGVQMKMMSDCSATSRKLKLVLCMSQMNVA